MIEFNASLNDFTLIEILIFEVLKNHFKTEHTVQIKKPVANNWLFYLGRGRFILTY